MKTLLIDHDDSFTYNLRDWLSPVFSEVEVINHRDLLRDPLNTNYNVDLIVLSPGPKNPQAYPHVVEFVKNQTLPIYGVCLGLQILVLANGEDNGGDVQAYTPPLHGKTSRLNFINSSLTANYNALQNCKVARYHSLRCVDYSPADFETIAQAENDQVPLWLKHTSKKWMGVQFHPESFLTEKPALHLVFLKEWLRR